MLISCYSERQKRNERKTALVLGFLRDETWTTPLMISVLLELSLASAYKTLNALVKKSLVVKYNVEDIKQVVYGITTLGLIESWSYTEKQPEKRAYFQPSKIKAVMVNHHLMLQQSRLNAEKVGWKDWMPAKLLPNDIPKKPDAVVKSRGHETVAVELERSMKTQKRYETIWSIYLQAIRRGDYDVVHYIVPNQRFLASLNRMFSLITFIPVGGKRVKIEDKHRAKFMIFAINDWPILI